ncbi:MAG: DUF6020 family protein [Lachnospiraceae bacterium]|nr:DUF6020 family protein [Lachnospiraceae bacterium]
MNPVFNKIDQKSFMGKINRKWTTVVMAVLTASAISIHMQFKTSNILTVLFILLCTFWYTGMDFRIQQHKTELILSFGFTVCMCLKGLETFDAYESVGLAGKLAIIGCQFLGFLILFYHVICFCYQWESKVQIFRDTDEKEGQKLKKRGILFFIVLLGILVCWFPYYLCNFPGIIISDTADQIQQAMGRYAYSNHHPVLQTWAIKGIFHLGMSLFGSANGAVALYCILQMGVIALIDTSLIMLLHQYRVKKCIIVFTFLYYAWMPYHVMYSFTMWKDSLFGAFLLLFIICAWRLLHGTVFAAAHNKWYVLVWLYLSGIGVSLFRTNGWYAFLASLPFFIVLFWKRQKKVVITLILTVVSVILIKGPVFDYYQVSDADFVESLSIPVQQIGRIVSEGCELSEEQLSFLNEIIDVDKISNTYQPYISDPMKGLIREKGNQTYLIEHKAEYLRLWLQLGLRYPSQYLRAFISQTSGYWYPDTQYWITADGIYSGGGEDITEAPVLSADVKKALEGFLWDYEDIPVIGLLFSIGLGVWLMFLQFGACIKYGKWKQSVLYVPVIMVWLTLLAATPVYAEFRYIYGLFTCLPILLLISFFDYREEIRS